MQNKILENLNLLQKFHYITKAQPNITPQGRSYNLNYYKNMLDKYIQETNGVFCLIIRGDDNTSNDFFAIPYTEIKDIFSPLTMYHDERGGSPCWKIYINTNQEIVNKETRYNISKFYGNIEYLPQLKKEVCLSTDSIIFAKIGWSTNGWQGFDEKGFENKADFGYRYIKETGLAHEWWNFYDYGDQYYYGHIQIGDKTPREFKKGLILFASVNPTSKKYFFIGFYGKAEYGTFKLPFEYTDTIHDEATRKYVKENYLFENFAWRAEKDYSTYFQEPIKFDPEKLGIVKWGQAAYIYVGDEKKISKTVTKKLLEEALQRNNSLLTQANENTRSKIIKDIEKIEKILNAYYKEPVMIENPANTIEDTTAKKYFHKQSIFYGPPGTGKTYAAFLRAHEILFGEPDTNATFSSIKKRLIESNSHDDLPYGSFTWIDAIFLAFDELKKDKATVTEIKNTNVITGVSSYKNREKNISNTLWAILQQYSVLNSKTVNYQHKNGREYFDKDDSSHWFITDIGREFFKSRSNEIQGASPTTDNQLSFVTFHQSYSYEEFIEGYRPDNEEEAESGTLGYELEDGIFKRMCIHAKKDPNNNYILIIDEINRGNISKIFGELITLIEENKRIGSKEEVFVTLPYSHEEFGVPSNLYIIGTMNSTDKSIALVDIALRRRFKFEKIPPDYTVIQNPAAFKLLKALNEKICALKNSDFEIGHSYFMKIPEPDPNNEQLKDIFTCQVLPLIEEYFYNDWEALATILGKESILKTQPVSKMYWNEMKGSFEPNSNDDENMYGRRLEDPEKIFENVLRMYTNETATE